jgi:DNA-binding CsgD family transcriptional regulator
MVDEQVIFNNPGRSAAILRRLDWSRTSLGKPDGWPEALRLSVRLVLCARHPMLIWWGDELIQFYNDSFAPTARAHRRAHGLGAPAETFWRRTWQQIGPDVQHVMSGQGGISREHQFIDSASSPASGAHFWSYSINPIFDQHRVGGALFLCRDETKGGRGKTAIQVRQAELVRVQQIGKFGGLEVLLTSGFQNRRSPEYLLLHGLPPEAASETHEDWVRRIHPEDRLRTENAFIEAVRGESRGYSIQYRIIRPSDGKVRWIFAKTEIERRWSGHPIRLIGAHADVTDEIDVSAIQRGQFTAALDLLRCAVMLVDGNGDIVYANQSATQMLTDGMYVRSRHNKIVAVIPSARAKMSEALKSAGGSHLKIALTVKLSDTLPVIAHVLPLESTELHSRIAPAVAAIFIREQRDARGSAALLASTYELTAAEARVLSHILSGRTLAETAEKLHVATSTVRTQLDVIFRKTGVNRQSELFLLSSQVSPPIRV